MDVRGASDGADEEVAHEMEARACDPAAPAGAGSVGDPQAGHTDGSHGFAFHVVSSNEQVRAMTSHTLQICHHQRRRTVGRIPSLVDKDMSYINQETR